MASEIIGQPLTLWLAPVGTPFPDFDEPESAYDPAWEKVGLSGDRNYGDGGVTVDLTQTLETWVPSGGTLPRKVWRTEESVELTVTVADVRAENLANALNGNAVTTGAGLKSISLLRGIEVQEYALLARGLSAYDETGVSQIQVPRCYQSAEPSIVFDKGEGAATELTFSSLDAEGDDDNFVWIASTPGS